VANAVTLQRIHRWNTKNGCALTNTEAGDYEGEIGKWLGVPITISSLSNVPEEECREKNL